MTPKALAQRIAPRLLLTVLLGFGAEGLLWSAPSDRAVLDLALTLVGLLASASILLDLMARWRVRDLYGLAAVGGLFALGYATLLNPTVTLRDLPLSLLTDVMGGQALIAMAMLLIFFVIAGSAGYWAWLGVPLGALIGVCWGVWLRWSPTLGDWGAAPTSPETVLLWGSGFAVAVLLLTVLTARLGPIPAEALRMGAYEMVLVGGVVIAALYRQFDSRAIDAPVYLTLSALAAVCVAMLWYRKDSYFSWLPDPWQAKPAALALLATLSVFVLAALWAYPQPAVQVGNLNLFDFIRLIFAIIALVWMPGVVVLIGLKAVMRDIQSKPL
jgi:hypothetical protein